MAVAGEAREHRLRLDHATLREQRLGDEGVQLVFQTAPLEDGHPASCLLLRRDGVAGEQLELCTDRRQPRKRHPQPELFVDRARPAVGAPGLVEVTEHRLQLGE